MNEIKFKGLTKDGNRVYGNLIANNARESDGIHKAEPLRAYIRERDLTWISEKADKSWRYLTFEVIPETVGQFVCKDKNGKDVFADDFVWFLWMGKKTKAQLTKDDLFNHLKSCEGNKQGLPRTFCNSDRQHIELIEGKENGKSVDK